MYVKIKVFTLLVLFHSKADEDKEMPNCNPTSGHVPEAEVTLLKINCLLFPSVFNYTEIFKSALQFFWFALLFLSAGVRQGDTTRTEAVQLTSKIP